jgi:hypothetical protein
MTYLNMHVRRNIQEAIFLPCYSCRRRYLSIKSCNNGDLILVVSGGSSGGAMAALQTVDFCNYYSLRSEITVG